MNPKGTSPPRSNPDPTIQQLQAEKAKKGVRRAATPRPRPAPIVELEAKNPKLAKVLEHWPRLLQHNAFPLVLMYTPKAGCTTLVKWFFFQIGELDQALKHHGWIHRYREVFQYKPDYLAQTSSVLLERRRPVVKLVRDPFRRAVSSFLHLCQVRNIEQRHPLNSSKRLLMRKVGRSTDRNSLSFREFAQALAIVGTQQDRINSHLARQYVPDEEILGARIIRLESFDVEMRAIEAEYGLQAAPLELITKSRHHLSGGTEFVAGAADIQATYQTFPVGKGPPYASFYDAETRALIASAYRRDFEVYGYDPNAPLGAPAAR